MVKPGHLRDLGKQHKDHLGHLMVQTRLSLHQEVYHEVLDAQLLSDWKQSIVLSKKRLQGSCWDKLRILRRRVLKAESESAYIFGIFSEFFQLIVCNLTMALRLLVRVQGVAELLKLRKHLTVILRSVDRNHGLTVLE